MASSNRHWPSMFKSKPCNTPHHPWQHDIIAPGCNRASYASVGGCEERSPDPKPRWNPKPEQIRILESIFNSGMVNPPRDEIRKIRAQLQEYGQVGDANVFYWFQNRKSRSKHKLRHLQNQNTKSQAHNIVSSPVVVPSSSSSSSDKSSHNSTNKNYHNTSNVVEMTNSPTASVNNFYFQPHGEVFPESYFFPTTGFTQGFCFPEVNVSNDQRVGNTSCLLLTDLMMSPGDLKKVEDEKMKLHLQQHLSYNNVTSAPITHPIVPLTSVTIPSTFNQIHEDLRSTVFINDVAFEVAKGPFNVRDAFGDDVVLLNSSGQPVITNDWGVTLHSLQNGAFYYLLHTLTTSNDTTTTIDLI